ncbi:MAG TPA: membrane dipeptidase [Candidatus Limnocylindria bacterium]|nr:membrane dipeptidase [Candidatus Limnocylindria bacterium]
MDASTVTARAAALLTSAVVWDNHTCMPLRPLDESFLPQLERFRGAGVNVVSVNVGFGELSIESHVRMLAQMRRWLSLRGEDYRIVSTPADIAAAKAEGKLGVFFDIEGAGAIDDQLSLIGLYYDLGVRWMSIAYNQGNRVGGGCLAPDGGLTEFGRAALDEMQRVGMITCCSHTGEKTTLDAIAYSSNPVIFSHSNPRGMRDHPRNITDRAITACAAKGGVVGVSGVSAFLGDYAIKPETLARHVDYVVQLAGIDHVAIGLDYVFDHEEMHEHFRKMKGAFPAGVVGYDGEELPIMAPERIGEVIEELFGLGYGEADIRKILGENLLRVARTVWK